jgi:hypothetical protein
MMDVVFRERSPIGIGIMRRTILLLLLAVVAGPTFAPAAEKKLDFNRDVRPILSENCFQCHGFDEKARQADLRLDLAESALAPRDGVPAIVAGHPEKSELWRRISTEEESELMPPPDSHRVLKPEQKDLLKRWIEHGAPYAKHWSFIPPVKGAVPEVHVDESLRDSNSRLGETQPRAWPRDVIDHFILDRLNAEGLQPSAEADRRTLIRRLNLDLIGLPPTATEVAAFVADESPDAYEKLVDRLLANPHFGERMALVWLDAARYADTNGFSIDGGRHMWLWRDWVINALNTNLPYDAFVREQLAGDLLPNRTNAQLIASGFQRNNANTHEGGTIPEENLVFYNADRVKTLGESLLGLTLGCAQCHDHKFDPITQRDYYQIYAYFNTLGDAPLDGDGGRNSTPVYQAKTVLDTGEEPALRERMEKLKQRLSNPAEDEVVRWIDDERAALARRGKDFELHPVELIKVSTPNMGSGFDIDPPRFVLITYPGNLVAYDVSMKLPKVDKPITGVRVVFHPYKGAPGGGRGYNSLAGRRVKGKRWSKAQVEGKGTFVLTTLSASADPVPGDQVNLSRLIGVSQVTADSWLPNYRPENVLDTRNDNGWSPTTDSDGPAHITLTFDKPVDVNETPYMTVQTNFGHGNRLVGARFEFLAMTGTDDGSTLPREIIDVIEPKGEPVAATSDGSAAVGRTILSVLPNETAKGTDKIVRPTGEQLQTLRQYFADHAEATKRDRTELANLEERLSVLTEEHPTMVMNIAEKPRETFILKRGDYSQPTEKVTPGTPSALPPLPAGAPDNRLGLAEWLTMREHPLTARVEVNRLWSLFFGTGIVSTPADFGAQGQYPSHPELLDWLAVDFVESGWDVKRLVKNW